MRRRYLIAAVLSLSILGFVAAGVLGRGHPARVPGRPTVPATHETQAAAGAVGPAISPAALRPGEGRSASPPLVTEWSPADRRRVINSIDISYVDQDGGTGRLGDLIDRPTVITFFYTRCQYANKCSRTLGHLAALQRELAQAGVGKQVRLIAITYEPQYDTPDRIKRYGGDRGLTFSEGAGGCNLTFHGIDSWLTNWKSRWATTLATLTRTALNFT